MWIETFSFSEELQNQWSLSCFCSFNNCSGYIERMVLLSLSYIFSPFACNGDLFGKKYTDIGFCAYPVWHSIYFSNLKLHVSKPESLIYSPKPSLSQLMATSFFQLARVTITVITGSSFVYFPHPINQKFPFDSAFTSTSPILALSTIISPLITAVASKKISLLIFLFTYFLFSKCSQSSDFKTWVRSCCSFAQNLKMALHFLQSESQRPYSDMLPPPAALPELSFFIRCQPVSLLVITWTCQALFHEGQKSKQVLPTEAGAQLIFI